MQASRYFDRIFRPPCLRGDSWKRASSRVAKTSAPQNKQPCNADNFMVKTRNKSVAKCAPFKINVLTGITPVFIEIWPICLLGK